MSTAVGRVCWPLLSCFVAFALWSCSDDDEDNDTQTPAPLVLGQWFDDPLQPLPSSLAGFGIYPRAPALQVDPTRVIAYEPAYPLWSNASAKARHLVLPQGAKIDNTQPLWSLPVGSVLFKTFSFPVADAPTTLRHVETRVMRRTATGWEFGSYLWDDAGKDAAQLDMRRAVPVSIDLPQGGSFEHMVPNKLECRACHEASPSATLGLRAAQLPLGQVTAPIGVEVFAAPLQPQAALDEDPTLAWVKGYMLGNCVHCHNGSEQNTNSTYSLAPEAFLANTINQDTEGNASAVGKRIVPGDPNASVLYQALRGYDDDPELKAMPPLGVQRRDEAAIERVRAWIAGLTP